jgi:hypothetical protein
VSGRGLEAVRRPGDAPVARRYPHGAAPAPRPSMRAVGHRVLGPSLVPGEGWPALRRADA